ncbi:hypothetical protein [Mesorhizobium sp. M1A.F.Ca.IN.020.04.1.1]|uniref:hypothetical protein n=1 Tax=Mesorhizobium sp. M1A.F.Ca.IN.020.04.1.1 TaxID=2496761 RepID=UPI000FCCD01D|nr:hypothetical protein [Mesorhizobium sp. M1A.F.Ca.IN.020.04.1.1]RUW04013.1 hypothetical protein EOA49_00345 [Mesorhizobium sp. M1A.F.Ca.IN.020.04.1.1]RUW04076.1 hypothetical protein EOA49_00680 [Mesorhizobium sp. M1A.F.Ca.IN.020.04.1.1]
MAANRIEEEAWRDAAIEQQKRAQRSEAEAKRLKAELSRSREAEKRLREALEPFGKALDVLGRNRHELHDKETIRGYGPDLAITMGDLRRALATVEGRET